MRLVSEGLKTLMRSPTRRMGPPPMGDSGKLREFSRQMRRAVLGTLRLRQAARVPIKPTS